MNKNIICESVATLNFATDVSAGADALMKKFVGAVELEWKNIIRESVATFL